MTRTDVMERFAERIGAGLRAILLGSTVLSVVSVARPATAQEARSDAEVRAFSVPAGSLASGLNNLAAQAGLQIMFDAGLAEGKTTAGIRGTMTPAAALDAILTGTGVQARFSGATQVLLSPIHLDSSQPDDDAVMLGTIVLYGDRAATTLGESRASVAVVRAEPEAAPAAASVKDAFQRMGNVAASDWNDSGFMIRGVNAEGFIPGANGSPLASFYVDGVQQTNDGTRRGVRGFFDMEQLEVYRGPQSTLSGRAALAGAMYLRSKDPEFERSGAAQLTIGSNSRRQAGLAFGDALGDRLAYRVSVEYSEKKSDLKYPGYERFAKYKDFITDDYYNIRGKLLWLPAGDDTTRVLFSYSHSFDSPDYDDVAGPGWAYGSHPYRDRRGDIWALAPVYQEMRGTKVDNFGVEVTHDINDNLRFTALTGFSRSKTDRSSINAGTPGETRVTEGEYVQRTVAQEFRLNHDAEGLKWVLGLYASHLDNDAWRRTQTSRLDTSSGNLTMKSAALFGEVTYEFTPGWSVIAGGRYDWISTRQTNFATRNSVVTADTATTFTDTVFLPKLGLAWDINEDHNLALTFQKGYRPGGSGVLLSDGSIYDYDPEYADTLELSWRGRFMDDRLSVSANAFYSDWEGQQVEVLIDPTDPVSDNIYANAGKSVSRGMEIELSYSANDELEIFGSVGLLKTKFKEFSVSSWGGDFSGLPFPNAPEQSIALGFRWAQDGGWFAAASAKYTGSQMSRLEQGVARPVQLGAYTTVDAEVGYAWEKVRLTAYAKNLFDKEYRTYELGPNSIAVLGDRREVGMRLDYRF
ncbi:TonB-dependent receptor [Xinfangfangia sp. D13-10-4-6]|uniref:TonB-dependent receptor domain-containing protein n=1 Tax=Pseudogemmobacter hezensis TaxID=2737662 RepID=UPI001554E4C4|nr:TonB-dependent receptor [Pseudogemmobacter hezensis]NPD17426.1 TonB-dependent receptor [Pseudogemmobacter hezensis]